jgi:hypothetical protein
MKNSSLFIVLFLMFSGFVLVQKNSNILLGRVYTKAASNTNSSNLKFNTSSTGSSITTVSVLGRKVETEISFTYKITGSKLTIIYEQDLGTEEYTIDDKSSRLVSTHLQGYVDGKWGQIYWILEGRK